MPENTDHAAATEHQLPDFAVIDVLVSDDRMSASLRIRPVEGASGELTVNHLKAALAAAEVARGINPSALKAAAEEWNKHPRELEAASVARGILAEAERAGALRVGVKHLTGPDDIELMQKCAHCWEAAAIAARFQRVDKGTVVARRAPASPSLWGYDIFGSPLIPGESDLPMLDAISERNYIYAASNTYTAAATGVVYVDDSRVPKLWPLDFNGAAKVSVARDMMSAELTLMPPGERGEMPSIAAVREMLKSAGVVFGINDDELHYMHSRFANGTAAAPETAVIAHGRPAVKGDDGRVEFCFNTESSPTPLMNPDGSADYRSINIVTSVSAGTVLARLHPPTKGVPGMDVAGRPLAAADGSPAMLPVGTGAIISPDAPDTLVAATNGIVRFDGSAVNVSEGYAVSGHVDYSTGNISYENSVAVNGDVKSGFEVNCGGDLQVNGTIEDAKVTVRGNVLCRYGFVGTGKGVIVARGDVNLVYVKNQAIVSEGNVNIAKESINSIIKARRSIKIYGHHLSVAGGTLTANESIIVKTAGNVSGISTSLVIEPDPELVAQMSAMKTGRETHEINVKKLTQTLDTLPHVKRQDAEFVRKLKNTIATIKQEAVALEEKMRELNAVINRFENAFIRVDRCAYPGTVFQFGQRHMALKEMLAGGKTLRMVDGEIKVL